jgi:hypothetical protein
VQQIKPELMHLENLEVVIGDLKVDGVEDETAL